LAVIDTIRKKVPKRDYELTIPHFPLRRWPRIT